MALQIALLTFGSSDGKLMKYNMSYNNSPNIERERGNWMPVFSSLSTVVFATSIYHDLWHAQLLDSRI